MKQTLVLKERVQELTKDSVDRDEDQFKIFRGTKKLLPKEANKAAAQRHTHAKWSSFAENFTEPDFKKATKNINVCNDSAQMMQVFQTVGRASPCENLASFFCGESQDSTNVLASMSWNATKQHTRVNTNMAPNMLMSSPYYDRAKQPILESRV